MPRIKRGGYVFQWWKSDHDPAHVHVFKDGREVLKWDLKAWTALDGTPTGRIIALLCQLRDEGLLPESGQ